MSFNQQVTDDFERARKTMATLAALVAMRLTGDAEAESLLAAEVPAEDEALFGQAALTMLQTIAAQDPQRLDDDAEFSRVDRRLRKATQAMMTGHAGKAFRLVRGQLSVEQATTAIADALLTAGGGDVDMACVQARRWCQAYQLIQS